MNVEAISAVVGMLTMLVGAGGLWWQRRADAQRSMAEAQRIRQQLTEVTSAVSPPDHPSLSQWMRSVDISLDGIRSDARVDRADLAAMRADNLAEFRIIHRRISSIEKESQ